MYIQKLILENFKSYGKDKEDGKGISFEFSPGINYLVGNNNSGKTTIFHAIKFLQNGLQNGTDKESYITKGKEDDDVYVSVTFAGNDISQICEADGNLKKYASYIDKTDPEEERLTIARGSHEDTWIDSRGKTKTLSIKTIRIMNPGTQEFENPAGIDKTISALFDAQFVDSDLDNGEYQTFKKTKILGRLINGAVNSFKETSEWQDFQSAHSAAFGDGERAFPKQLNDLSSQIKHLLDEQYGGENEVKFTFGMPEIASFFDNGDIELGENGVSTSVSEKGTGMQRALAMAIIQIYAARSTADVDDAGAPSKPLFFFLDEPETFLHPMAQDKLLGALTELSKRNQIFITTHSPYLLRNFNAESDTLKVFNRNLPERYKESITLDTFKKANETGYHPTWGEINYLAFEFPSIEFHIELFGFLQDLSGSNSSIASFDNWLASQPGCPKVDSRHTNRYGKHTDLSLSAYIRNWFDHPGEDDSKLQASQARTKPTFEEIRESTEFMMRLLKPLKKQNGISNR